MNKEDVIKLARAAGCHDNGEEFRFVELRYLERFAALVDAAAVRETSAEYRLGWNDGQMMERKACAELLDEMAARDKLSNYYAIAAKAIRERGQA